MPKLTKILQVRWNLSTDYLTKYPPSHGFVMCDDQFNITLLSHDPSYNFKNHEFKRGDMVVYCNGPVNNPTVVACRSYGSIRFPGLMDKMMKCGRVTVSELGQTPQGFSQVVKQAIVLFKMLIALEPMEPRREPIEYVAKKIVQAMAVAIDNNIVVNMSNQIIKQRSTP